MKIVLGKLDFNKKLYGLYLALSGTIQGVNTARIKGADVIIQNILQSAIQ